jgi:MazG family protein
MLKITGLGCGEYDFLTIGAMRAFEEAEIVILQTDKMPCAKEIYQKAKEFYTLDSFFEKAQDFNELYGQAADFIAGRSAGKNVVFGVLGNLHANGFVAALKNKTDFEVIPGTSFEGEALCFSGKYVEIGAFQSVAARDLKKLHLDSSCALVVTEIDNPLLASDVKLFLTEYYDDETGISWVCGRDSRKIALQELDLQTNFGTGASIVLPALKDTARVRFTFGDLVDIMDRLRGRDGCPWDLEQTHETLRQYVLEEAYEVVQAVDQNDPVALADELGDLLLQVVFHAQIGKQMGNFNIADVTSNICSKMINRHPHIFGDTQVGSSEDVLVNWEAIKRSEKGLGSTTQAMEDIPLGMSALMRANKIQKKAAHAGFDWDNAGQALEKIKEETVELEAELQSGSKQDMEGEAGDLLFAVVNVLRLLHINPEVALVRANRKFINRFRYVEEKAGANLAVMSLAEMDVLWDDAKRLGL